jgi:hypothetical protein
MPQITRKTGTRIPATHTSQSQLKRKFDALAVKLPANTITALSHNTKNLRHMSLNCAQCAKNHTSNCDSSLMLK